MKKFLARFLKKIKEGRFKNYYWILGLILLSLPVFWRLLIPGHLPIHDDLQVGRLYQMDLCWRDGQIPCRWVPDMGFGYGYPLFNYYPPLPYYLGEIFHLLGFSFINSVKILFILALFFSGFFAYLLGKELWGKYGGLVVAAFYLYAPYHAVDVYVRGALNEFWGLVFFPALFWAVYQLIKKESKVFVFWLAFFLGLIFLSHNLMAFFIMPVLGFWALFLIWYSKNKVLPKAGSYSKNKVLPKAGSYSKNKVLPKAGSYSKKRLKIIGWLIAGGLWGLCLSAFFTLPVFFERKFVHIETMFIGYFNYLAHFADIYQLFFSRFWGFGASVWGPQDGMSFAIGQLHWLVGFAALLIFIWFWLKRKQKEIWLVTFLFVFFLGTAFLAHQRSSFLWSAIPVLANMQFPWRFVGLSTFFVSLMSGSFFLLIKNNKKAFLLSLLLILTVVVLDFNFFRPEKILKITDEEKLFSAQGWYKLQTDTIFDYLPIYVPQPPAGPAPQEPWFARGEGGEIKNFQKGTNWEKFEADVEGESIIKLPLYDFPNWQVLANGKQVEINHQNELGLIAFRLGAGSYQIEARLKNTPIRTAGNLISLLAWISLVFFLFKRKLGNKNK